MKYLRAACLVGATLAGSCEAVESPSAPGDLTPPRNFTDVSLSQSSVIIGRHASVQLKATAAYSDGSTEDVTAFAAWTTTDAAVAAVSSGAVTGSGPGKTQVQVRFGGRTASSEVTVRRNIAMASRVTVFATDPRFTNIAALRAFLDDTFIRQVDMGSDHAATRTMTIALSEVNVSPGEHSIKVDVVRFGWTLDDRPAAATTTYTTAPAPVIQLRDADNGELLASLALPVQVVDARAEGPTIATITWQFSVPAFDY